MSEIVPVDPRHPEQEIIRRACRLLEAGELIVVPTETVYGAACDPAQPEKLYAAKERDRGKPLARLISGLEQAESLGAVFGVTGRRLAETYWPGPLTLVLDTPDGTTGFRVPDHAVPLSLARAFGRPVALTSANRSGEADAVSAQEAFNALQPHAALVLDAGRCTGQIPSTVVLCREDRLTVLREGAISIKEILSFSA